MRNLIIWGLCGLFCLGGCQSFRGPLQSQQPVRADDPLLPPIEQKKYGRAQFPYPDDSTEVGLNSGILPPTYGGGFYTSGGGF